MFFIDGVGIGEKDPAKNPFFRLGFKAFEEIFGEVPHLNKPELNKDGIFLFPTDARLGVEGLPQSGTGQVSIFCGINAPQYVGKHFGPFPFSTTIPVISEKNILKYFKDQSRKVLFANAYPKVFFDYIKSGKTRLSVTSLSCKLSGVKLNTVSDVKKAKALTAEITNERWNNKLNYKLPIIEPETGARRLLKLAAQNDFTLYEYFLTDHLGHGRIPDEFERIYSNIDRFLFTLLTELDREKMTFVLCSDHGNFEDLSVKTHTFNPSLTIAAGYNAENIARGIKDLTDIKSSIIKFCN